MSELLIRKKIEIDVPVETLWKVLTDNEFIQQYMFNCYTETDWKPGSPLLWKGVTDGRLYVKGHVVAIDPPHRLVFTVIDPNSAVPDVPENYLTMTYLLTGQNGHGSVLELTQGDFAKVAEGPQRYKDSLDGDDTVLNGIKRLAEAANSPVVSKS
jgi:uncharacterized protein YndB with AHSA1/START domain